MNTNPTYTQCLLEKAGKRHTAWLPSQMAVPGIYVCLRDRDTKIWEDGFQVIDAYTNTQRQEEDVLEAERDYKHQREASDI